MPSTVIYNTHINHTVIIPTRYLSFLKAPARSTLPPIPPYSLPILLVHSHSSTFSLIASTFPLILPLSYPTRPLSSFTFPLIPECFSSSTLPPIHHVPSHFSSPLLVHRVYDILHAPGPPRCSSHPPGTLLSSTLPHIILISPGFHSCFPGSLAGFSDGSLAATLDGSLTSLG